MVLRVARFIVFARSEEMLGLAAVQWGAGVVPATLGCACMAK
jgi:hypothetical protein